MVKSQDLQWLDFTDFSPGIFSNNQLAGGVQVTSTNPAMAQVTNTYRCLPLPTGGLGPAPRRVIQRGLTTLPASGTGKTYTVSGMNTWGRILPNPSSTQSVELFELHLGLYYESGTTATQLWLRERLFDTPSSTETLLSKTDAATAPTTPRFAQFLKTRMNPTTPLNPGVPVMVMVGSTVGGSPISRAYPDPATPSTNSTIVVGDETYAYTWGVAHQGRVVLSRFIFYDHGLTASILTDENLVWTNVNNVTLSSSTPAALVPEIDQTIADMGAMSANALFVVKLWGGGYVIQGDLDDPTIVQLPNIASPGSAAIARGCNTSEGFVYSAGKRGFYKWNGGDQAEWISKQLDGLFAVGQTLAAEGYGQCTQFFDLLAAPSNWLWDMNAKSWWRLEDPADVEIKFFSSTVNDRLVGTLGRFTDANANTFINIYYRDTLATSYSWQSHPLWVSQDKYLQTRQMIAGLQGHGTVTFSLINETGEVDVHTVEVDSDVIRNFRFNTTMDAENLQLRIESAGENATTDAPLVHRVFVGYHTQQHLPVVG